MSNCSPVVPPVFSRNVENVSSASDANQPVRVDFREYDAAVRHRDRTFGAVEPFFQELNSGSTLHDAGNVGSDGVRGRRKRSAAATLRREGRRYHTDRRRKRERTASHEQTSRW